MNRKQIFIFTLVLIIVIAFFEFAFLEPASRNKLTISDNNQNLFLYFLIISLSIIPCLLLGYGRFNPFLGLIPPVLLNGLFWVLISMRLSSLESPVTIKDGYVRYAFMMTFTVGVFGIIITYLAAKIADKYSKNKESKKTPDKKEIVETEARTPEKKAEDKADTVKAEEEKSDSDKNSEKDED